MDEFEKEAIELIEEQKNIEKSCRMALEILFDSQELAEYFFEHRDNFREQMSGELKAIEKIKNFNQDKVHNVVFNPESLESTFNQLEDGEAIAEDLPEEDLKKLENIEKETIGRLPKNITEETSSLKKIYGKQLRKRLEIKTKPRYRSIVETSMCRGKNKFTEAQLSEAIRCINCLCPKDAFTKKRKVADRSLEGMYAHPKVTGKLLMGGFEKLLRKKLGENYEPDPEFNIFQPCNLAYAYILLNILAPKYPELENNFIKAEGIFKPDDFVKLANTLRKRVFGLSEF